MILSSKVNDFIDKYLFPFNYWPYIAGFIALVIILIIIYRKKIKENIYLFTTFFKLGLFTFGGGYAMIPTLKEIVVENKKWLTNDEMLEVLAIAETTPGPIAINMATFIGYKQGKVLGSFLATLGVVLPSLIIIYIVSLIFDQFISNPYVAAAFVGIKACVAFLIIKAGWGMLVKMKKNTFNVALFSIIFILLIVFELTSTSFSSIYLILFGGISCIAINLLQSIKRKEDK